MSELYAITGLLAAAMITPGPNNFAILRVAATGSVCRVASSIAGVVLGGIAMAAICLLGIGTWIVDRPAVNTAIAALGSAYLLGCAWHMIIAPATDRTGDAADRSSAIASGGLGLFVFQFLNPKAWVLILTVTSMLQAMQAGARQLSLAALTFLLVSSLCLLTWTLFGSVAARLLRSPSGTRTLNRVLGVALAVSVCFLWR